MNDTIRVVINAFIWAIIGGFVALDASRRFDLGHEYLWALCGMVGAPLGAYCTINFREFCAGVRRAFVKTISWRPFWLYWKTAGFLFCGSFVAIAMTFAFTRHFTVPDEDIVGLLQTAVDVAFLGAFVVFFISEVGFPRRRLTDEYNNKKYKYYKKVSIMLALGGNPIGLVCALCVLMYYALQGAYWLIRKVPAVTVSTCRLVSCTFCALVAFTKQVFIEVHSDLRTICGLSTAIGVVVGYFLGDIPLCGIVAAILGAVSREVIAIRWLKVVPRRA